MDFTSIIIAAINPFFALLSLIATGLLSIITIKINRKVNAAKEINEDTNALVNSNTELQLKNAVNIANRTADQTNAKEDIAEAEECKRLYDEHILKRNC